MKVSREKAALNRKKVLETAGRMFREHGFDGVGIADLMKEAGLTVGGFYKNFKSKEELLAECCKYTNQQHLEKWKDYLADPTIVSPYKRIGSSYLSAKNRDNLSTTCIYSTLANEVPRHEAEVKEVFSESVDELVEFMTALISEGSYEERRSKAIVTFSQWLGALMLARVAGQTELSEEILKIARLATEVD